MAAKLLQTGYKHDDFRGYGSRYGVMKVRKGVYYPRTMFRKRRHILKRAPLKDWNTYRDNKSFYKDWLNRKDDIHNNTNPVYLMSDIYAAYEDYKEVIQW